MLYNTSITLKYHTCEDHDLADTIYRSEMVKVFDMEHFDIDIINRKVEKVYELLMIDNSLKQQIKENAGRILSEDMLIGFMLCFSFDQFHKTHEYICKHLPQMREITHVYGD